MSKKTKRVNLGISKAMFDKFTTKCNELETTKSEVLRRAIYKFINKKNKDD